VNSKSDQNKLDNDLENVMDEQNKFWRDKFAEDSDFTNIFYDQHTAEVFAKSDILNNVIKKSKVYGREIYREQKEEFQKDKIKYMANMFKTGVECYFKKSACLIKGFSYLLKVAVRVEGQSLGENGIKYMMENKFNEWPEDSQLMIEFVMTEMNNEFLGKLENKLDDKTKSLLEELEIGKKDYPDKKTFKDKFKKQIEEATSSLKTTAKNLGRASTIIDMGLTGLEYKKKFEQFKENKNQEKERNSLANPDYKLRGKLQSSMDMLELDIGPSSDHLLENFKNNYNRNMGTYMIKEIETHKESLMKKSINLIKKVGKKIEDVNGVVDKISEFQYDLSLILPSFEDYFKLGKDMIKKFIIQIFGLGFFNIITYGWTLIKFVINFVRALNEKKMIDRWRSYGTLIGDIIRFFRGDIFSKMQNSFFSLFKKNRRFMKKLKRFR